MTITERVVRVAVFNCGYTCPSIQKERGQYHEIFDSLLQPAVRRLSSGAYTKTKPKLLVSGWDTTKNQYPPTLEGIHAIIISGSPNGAYQDLEWIHALNKYVAHVYHDYPSIKLYGSCFGHQVICKALFEDRGVIVEKDPSGWELGVHTVDVSDDFARHFPEALGSESRSLTLQFLHGDHVRLDNARLPASICVVGSTPHCHNQGIYEPGRLLTLQGHPEFDQFITNEALKLVSQRVGWESEFTKAAIKSAMAGDDAGVAADIMVRFLLGLDTE